MQLNHNKKEALFVLDEMHRLLQLSKYDELKELCNEYPNVNELLDNTITAHDEVVKEYERAYGYQK